MKHEDVLMRCTHPACRSSLASCTRANLEAHLSQGHLEDNMPSEPSPPKMEKSKAPLRPYACQSCGREFLKAKHLHRHKAMHDRPHACQSCDRKFALKKDLRRHEATHAAGAIFRCVQCGAEFSRRDSLVRHVNGTHVDSSVEVST